MHTSGICIQVVYAYQLRGFILIQICMFEDKFSEPIVHLKACFTQRQQLHRLAY